MNDDNVNDFREKNIPRPRKWWKDPGLRKNLLSVVLLYSPSFALGFSQSTMNALQALPVWNETFHHPSGIRLGLIVVALYLGQLTVIPIIHHIVDRLGRKTTLVLGSLFTVIGSLISGLARTKIMFIIGRVIIGPGLRLSFVGSILLMNELIYPGFRAMCGAFSMVAFSTGSLVASWLPLVCLGWHSHWQWSLIVLLQIIPPAIVLVGLLFIPESPRWLVYKGKRRQALDILAKHHANGNPQDDLVQREYEEIVVHIQRDRESETIATWKSLLHTAENRRRLFILTLAVSGDYLLGISMVRIYFTVILQSIGIQRSTYLIAANGGMAAWFTISSCIGALWVEKAGRRTIYLVSTMGMLLSMCVITALSALFSYHSLRTIAIAIIAMFMAFTGFHVSGWTALVTLYSVEILPFSMRSKGQAVSTGLEVLAVGYSSFVDPIALQAIQWKYYFVYIAIQAIYLGLIWKLFVETRGCTIEQASMVLAKLSRKELVHVEESKEQG